MSRIIWAFFISCNLSAQTVEEIRLVVEKDCAKEMRSLGFKTFSCEFAKKEISIDETCEKDSRNITAARLSLDELAGKYSKLAGANEEQVRAALCKEALNARKEKESPECNTEKLGSGNIERTWWNGEAWTSTKERLDEVVQKAEKGIALYEVNLGYWLENSQKCVEKDLAAAVKYYCKASDRKDKMAWIQLNKIGISHGLPSELAREGLGQKYGCDLTEKQVAKKNEDKELEAEFQKSLILAQKSNSKAMYEVATAFMNGDGTKEDSKQAFYWAEKGAKAKYLDSMVLLASFYSRGEGVESNQELAYEWTLKAAKAGDRDSKLFLGDLYYNGQGTDVNKAEAIKWYLAAHEAGNTEARSRLQEMSLKGELQIEILKKLK